MTLGERIKELRKAKNLTQQEFANQIGTTRNNIAGYETGRREPSAAAVNLIITKMHVSETWLRTGEGKMFLPQAVENELSVAVHRLLSGESSEFKSRLIKVLADLGPREWDILESYVMKLAQSPATPAIAVVSANTPTRAEKPITEWTDIDIDAETEAYRQEIVKEKSQAARSQALPDTGDGTRMA